jgi:hypothetical protein
MKTTLEVDLKRVALEKARTFARMHNSDLASLVSQYIEELAEKQGREEEHSMRPQPHHGYPEELRHTGHFLG